MNLLALALLVLSFTFITNAEVVYTNHTSMDEGRYKVWWTFNNATDTFYFKVEVEANGWIGFGITQLEYGGDWMRNGMDTYDVLVAGVYGLNRTAHGLSYLVIHQNRSQYPDHVDEEKDWIVTKAKEDGNKTTLEFYRKRVTPNPLNTHFVPRKGDIQITPGLRYFVWAYHKTIDTPILDKISLKHDKSGLEPVVLLPVEKNEPIIRTPSDKMARENHGNIPVISSLILLFPLLLMADTIY